MRQHLFTGVQVNRWQRRDHRRYGLDTEPGDQWHAVGHAAFGTTKLVGVPLPGVIRVGYRQDYVLHFGTALSGNLPTGSNRNRLYSIDRHQCLSH